MTDSAEKNASRVTVGDVDYYYAAPVYPDVKAKLEEGEKVPVWIREEKGADYAGWINGQKFVVRSSEGADTPRMVPPAIAGNLWDGREAERAHRADIEQRKREAARPLNEMPEYIR